MATALLYSSARQPHSSLGGATALEAFDRSTPAPCKTAIRSPLDTGPGTDQRIARIDEERRLPVLARAA